MKFKLPKTRWKWTLSLTVIIIITVSLWYNNIIVHQFAKNEQNNLIIWADAIRHRAELVKSTEVFFEKLEEEERSKVEILAEATRMLENETNYKNLSFYLKISSNNTTIPVIQTDESLNIIGARNVDFNVDTVPVLEGDLLKEFTKYKPITISSFGVKNFMFYKDSKHSTQLRQYLQSLIDDFFAETVINSASVPVIITDSTKTNIIATGNIPDNQKADTAFLLNKIQKLYTSGSPIELDFADNKNFIFYEESPYIFRLKIYPIIQYGILILFFVISYFLFSTAWKSEQNQVWAGLAKETAHQLGTPLSSIMAWVELLKMKGEDEIASEINKDALRLETITSRFSKIGSEPNLESADVVSVVNNSINYLKKRTSDKVNFHINETEPIYAPISVVLFEWVIENICKNAVDAMNGKGDININIKRQNSHSVIIDISDSGKGIPRKLQRKIFNPGVTSKTRGWGLGLSLAKRIIEDIHHGKIFVKCSIPYKETTFRIILQSEDYYK
ncbi:MAG: sensor histidine kinase [Bacteroidales bacterium]